MGYRSEVRCLIYGAPDQIDAFVASQVLAGNSWFAGENKDAVTRRNGVASQYLGEDGKPRIYDVLDMYGDGWRWYEDYPDVAEWVAMLASIANEELPFAIAYEFIRIGEEAGDVEKDSGGNIDLIGYWLSITTPKIVCVLPEPLSARPTKQQED